MDDVPTYGELAQELIRELFSLARVLPPVTLNASRGETALLMTLYRADRALTPGQLGEGAHVSSARIANILRSLEEKGLISRTHSSEDRRQVEVTLTADGRAEAERTRAGRTQAVARYLSALGEQDSAHLVRILGRTVDILRDHEAREGAGA